MAHAYTKDNHLTITGFLSNSLPVYFLKPMNRCLTRSKLTKQWFIWTHNLKIKSIMETNVSIMFKVAPSQKMEKMPESRRNSLSSILSPIPALPSHPFPYSKCILFLNINFYFTFTTIFLFIFTHVAAGLVQSYSSSGFALKHYKITPTHVLLCSQKKRSGSPLI